MQYAVLILFYNYYYFFYNLFLQIIFMQFYFIWLRKKQITAKL